MNGEVVELSKVPDEAFASGVLGGGCAIDPADGRVYAPADGTVSTVMDTGHAVGITTKEGAELLIHVGMDTVKLNGAPFTVKVKEGDKVRKGDLLLTADLAAIRKAGLPTITPVLVSNSDEYVSIKVNAQGTVNNGDLLYTIV